MKPGVLVVADTGKSPPGSMSDANGQPAGAYIDLANKWAADLGLKLEVVFVDWPTVLPGVQSGKFDLGGSGVDRTPARLASKDFIMSDPFIAYGVNLLVKKSSGIQNWDDMKGKKLGVTRGENEGDVAKARIGSIVSGVTEYSGYQDGLLDILNGRIDGFATGGPPLAYLVKTAPNGDQLAVVGTPLQVIGEGVAVHEQCPALAQAIDKLIAQYLKDGTLETIYTKWYGTPSPVDILQEMQKQ